MHRLWYDITEPVLSAADLDTIVEIGTGSGAQTRLLVEFCEPRGISLHSMDPAPGPEVQELVEQNPETLAFHQQLSLNALPLIGAMDAVLIDGDHNWYTVLNELRLIDRISNQHNKSFPLVMLHDVGWPYGRRDMYYFPENVPDAHRKPYKRKGISPDVPGLMESGGLNRHLANSIYENQLHSGVLTAVEDFLTETGDDKKLVIIPGFHSLAILTSEATLKDNPDLGVVVDRIVGHVTGFSLIERLEEARIRTSIRAEDLGETLRSLRSTLETTNAQKENALRERDVIASSLREAEAALKNKQDAISKLSEVEAELQAKEDSLSQKERELRAAYGNVDRLNKELATANSALSDREAQYGRTAEDVRKLSRWIDEIELGFTFLLHTRRWRVGNRLGKIWRRATFRKDVAEPPSLVLPVLRDFHAWRKHGHEEFSKKGPMAAEPFRAGTAAQDGAKRGIDNAMVASKTADVVVCVHNALGDTRKCLQSVARFTDPRHRLIIVDDGSKVETRRFLERIVSALPGSLLVRNTRAVGYSAAANQGLKASDADYVVLLNSDTMVTPLWLEKLIECGESDQRIGIVGPLSNSASWQSVPELSDPRSGDWAMNPLPEGIDAAYMSQTIDQLSSRSFPHVPFVNGFCYAIKRQVIDSIGYFDAETFLDAYGEENDYSIRAASAGFELAIADHTYVYHAKSKSYSTERRKQLSSANMEALYEKHGRERILAGVASMKSNQVLVQMRRGVKEALAEHRRDSGNGRIRVLYVLPVPGGGGGAHSVVQEAEEMRHMGIDAVVATKLEYRPRYLANYRHRIRSGELFYYYVDLEDLLRHSVQYDACIGTIHHSMHEIKAIVEAHPSILPAYYVQDYEPWFYSSGTPERAEAEDSYTRVPNTLTFAKTEWLCDLVGKRHNLDVFKVSPSLDHKIFFPGIPPMQKLEPVRITAMVRPKSSYRSPILTLEILHELKAEFGEAVEVRIFGSRAEEISRLRDSDDSFVDNRGELVQEEVGRLLRDSDVFLDFSVWQAFGRTALEAMACGCAVVVPTLGGSSEYARNLENAMIVDTSSRADCLRAARELVTDIKLRQSLQRAGILTAARFSTHRSAASVLQLLESALRRHAGLVA